MKESAKQYTVEQLPREVAELVAASQRQRVVLTRNGAPFALIVGIENKDEENLELMASPAFWRMIAESRRETDAVPLEEVIAELEAEENKLGGASTNEARAEGDTADRRAIKELEGRAAMRYLTADQPLLERLGGILEPVEIRDPSGKLLGRYTPVLPDEDEANARAATYFDLAEAERTLAEENQGSSPAEVWERIRALERPG
jgi:hypothetical protein